MFPELQPYLLKVFSQPDAGEYVITRYRDNHANLRTQFVRIIRKAGLKPWPKPFQNLRSTRETELAETYPEHVVCAWIGNSVPVARKHYLQVTNEHFELAAKRRTEAVQNPVQQAAGSDCTEVQATTDDPAENIDSSGVQIAAASCSDSSYQGMGPVGFEPTTKGL